MGAGVARKYFCEIFPSSMEAKGDARLSAGIGRWPLLRKLTGGAAVRQRERRNERRNKRQRIARWMRRRRPWWTMQAQQVGVGWSGWSADPLALEGWGI